MTSPDGAVGFFPDEEPQPDPQQSSSFKSISELIGRFSRRNSLSSGEFQRDEEEPLLGDDQQLGRSVASSPPVAWPALRLSSLSTRKLTVGSLGAAEGDQVMSPLAGGFSTSFLPQLSTRLSEPSTPRLPPVPETPYQPPPAPEPGGVPAPPPAHPENQGNHRVATSAVCGVINSIIAMPVMLSFAAIIFRDPFFRPLLGSLVKLVFLSSAIHQLCFTLFSTLPYAVGQVQDVGLIFLSALASDVVAECRKAGVGEADTLGTVLMSLTLSTAAVGLLIILTGVLKLASLVQYVPLPVVGGYLAYVGYFCLAAGISLASGVQVSTPETWVNLVDPEALVKLAPALGVTCLIAVILRRFRSPFALPLLLTAVPVVFYVALWGLGVSLEQAREAGWVTKAQEGEGEWRFWEAWSLYNVDSFPPKNIHWGAMPSQLGKLVALYFVVAFGSSMDVAAIQAESPSALDYNKELTTVGVSNLASAACGVGYTGSYIFSQTLFSLRMGVESPVMGAIVIASELAVFMLPFNVMAYLPNLFFGSLVMWIGQDILKDWLFIAYKRISLVEYCLLLGTLGGIMAVGLELGIAAGIVAAALHFAYSYAKVTVTAFSVVPSRSGAVRTFEQRTALEMFSTRITAVSLSGYLFFGSSVKVSERVVHIAAATLDTLPHKAYGFAPTAGPSGDAPPPPAGGGAACPAQHVQHGKAEGGAQGGEGAGGEVLGPPSPEPPFQSVREGTPALPTVLSGVLLDDCYDAVALYGPGARDWAATALEQAPRFLILDFRRVQGLDATAARTFVTLHARLHRMGIQLIITHLPASRPGIRKLLVGQGLILREPEGGGVAGGEREGEGEEGAGPACRWFGSMESGLQYCEERFLEVAVRYRLCKPTPTHISLPEVLRSHLQFPRSILPSDLDCSQAAELLGRFTQRQSISAGQVLFERGEPPDEIFIVECGSVLCAVDFMHSSAHSRAVDQALPPNLTARHSDRILRYGPGGIVGEMDFFLQRPRSFSAVCDQGGAVWCLRRGSLERMAREQLQVLAYLQTIILRSTSLSAAHALEALERSSPE